MMVPRENPASDGEGWYIHTAVSGRATLTSSRQTPPRPRTHPGTPTNPRTKEFKLHMYACHLPYDSTRILLYQITLLQLWEAQTTWYNYDKRDNDEILLRKALHLCAGSGFVSKPTGFEFVFSFVIVMIFDATASWPLWCAVELCLHLSVDSGMVKFIITIHG